MAHGEKPDRPTFARLRLAAMSERADPRAEAEQYLEKHQIPKLFEQLGAAVVYSKPDNPREFLISELRRIQSCKKSEHTVRAALRPPGVGRRGGVREPAAPGRCSSQPPPAPPPPRRRAALAADRPGHCHDVFHV